MPIYVLEKVYEGVMTAFKAVDDEAAMSRLYDEYGYFGGSHLYDDLYLYRYKRGRVAAKWEWSRRLDGGYWAVVDGI